MCSEQCYSVLLYTGVVFDVGVFEPADYLTPQGHAAARLIIALLLKYQCPHARLI